MASSSNNAPDSGLKKQLHDATSELNSAIDELVNAQAASKDLDQLQRRKVIDAADRIQELVKDPADQWIDMTWAITLATANRLFWEWGGFDSIPVDRSISYDELAAKMGTEVALLVRISRILIAAAVLRRDDDGNLVHTEKSKVFMAGGKAGLVYNMGWENLFVPYASAPRYFDTYGRKEPQTANHIVSSFAYGHPEWSLYEFILADPGRKARFPPAMAAVEERMPVGGIYDFTWLVDEIKKNQTPDRIAFVDIGGNKGNAIRTITDEFPGIPRNRCILQDRPETIEAVKAMDEPEMREVQKMVIDFNVEQPIRGAYVYYIRRCLHNYSDETSIKILTNIRKAMADDSKLLISEDVLAEPPHFFSAFMDFMMLTMGGKQRTREAWEEVTSAAGLKIASISSAKGPWKSMSVIECVKTL